MEVGMFRLFWWRVSVLVAVCLAGSLPAVQGQVQGQGRKPESSADKTVLEIELLLPAVSSDPLASQKWRKVFEELDVGVHIRQPLSDDKVEVTEVSRGPFRLVRLTGEITREGQVAFPDKTFKSSDVEGLREYFDELKLYGAQGAPDGKPMWGLSKEQFEVVFNALSAPIPEELAGTTFGEAIEKLALPESLKLTFHTSAEPIRQDWLKVEFKDEIQGVSTGTGLAFLLSQQGLGFRPLRSASGTLQLLVQPLADTPDAWPVGWPTDETQPRNVQFPELFKPVETGVNSSSLTSVLNEIELQSKTRILVDRTGALVKKLDPDELVVTFPRKKTAWALIISSVAVNSKMTMNYRQDEAATGFLYITPFEHYQPPASTPETSRPNGSTQGKRVTK